MTITDQLRIIDNKIKANQAQYDLGRSAAKTSAYFFGDFGDIRKYEYLTGEDLGYKPSVFEQAKFDYSPFGNVFNKGLDKDDQKEGLFKRPENIKEKNEELLDAFSAANKVGKAAKNVSDFHYDFRYAFYKFYRDFKKFKRMSLGSKYDEINYFYTLLNAFIKTHKWSTTETKNHKNRILNNANQIYNKYFDTYKRSYNSEKVKEKEKRGRDYKQFEIIDNGDQEPKSTKKEETEAKKTIEDVYNNQNNDKCKTTIDKKAYYLKNAKKVLVKITTQKNSEKEAFKLYSDLIFPNIAAL